MRRHRRFCTQQYPSGTTNVTESRGGEPWLYLAGGGVGTDEQIDRHKGAIADEITDYLNGGPRPIWLDDGDWSETSVRFPDGLCIVATGPMVDREPPTCWWVPDESATAQAARRALIRLLRNGPSKVVSP